MPRFEQEQVAQARRIMKPFVLRRLKREVLRDLPTKTDVTMLCPLEPTQQEKYADLIQTFSQQGSQAVINITRGNNCCGYIIISIYHICMQTDCYLLLTHLQFVVCACMHFYVCIYKM